MSDSTRQSSKRVRLKPCPLCGSPVMADETITATAPSSGYLWVMRARFTAKCDECSLTLDNTLLHDDILYSYCEYEAENFFGIMERLWNREEMPEEEEAE